MATNKPISTISYNTETFLKSVLQDLYKRHIIQCYMYIKHKGEDGDKDHIHLRIEPNKRIDPMDITAMFMEFEPGKDKPLTVRPWRPSKEEDWFLYAVHDKQYLKIKYSESKDGKLEYSSNDIVVSDGYDVDCALLRARQSLENHSACIVKQLKEGKRVMDLIEEGKDVFRTKAVLQTLQITDYERVTEQNIFLSDYLNKLEKAIKNFGLEIIEDQEGNLYLKD